MAESITWSDEELRAKVGQLFIVGFDGHVPNDDIKTLIEVHRVGAVILFQRNIESRDQLLKLTQSLQQIAKDAGHKQGLFIGIDQENGLVTRIKEPLAPQLPGPMALAATGDPHDARLVASATAETLKAYGINFNYAPDADVNSEPKNPVIGVRSFSDDPETVGRFVSAQVKGLQEGGVVPCVKHFPGHGDTATDSHYGLPVIEKSREQLDDCELVPFRRAVVEGVDAVMTAHIALPQISDSENLPASLNPDIINILREDMKYDGLIVSDCLEMDGVRAKYGTEKSAVMALKAGTDCTMICHTMSAQVGALNLVNQAIKSGELSQESIQKSVTRIEELKTKYLSNWSQTAPSDLEAMAGRQEVMASGLYAKTTTLVRSESGSFPIAPTLSNVVLLSPAKADEGGGAVGNSEREPNTISYIDLLRFRNPNAIEIRFTEDSLSPEEEKQVFGADAVILATKNANRSPTQKEFGLSLGKKLANKIIVVATCDPYDFLKEEDEIKNYITTYEPTISAFISAVDVIFGQVQANGTLPVGNKRGIEGIRLHNGSDEDSKKIWELWQQIFPSWPIESERMVKMLRNESGRYLIHEDGFCIAFNFDGMGKISAVGVLSKARRKGLGTALITRVKKELRSMGKIESLGIGSVFPRFWAGLAMDTKQEYKDFILHRGFRHSTEPTARDLYRNITVDVAPAETIEKINKLPLKYAPWSPDGYEECMQKQRANFSNNKAWVKAYEQFAAANQHHEIMVAFDGETGAQVGWTMMCSPTTVFCENFAFLPLTPGKDKTGIIACVGVDKSARGKGVGLALLVKAMENMRERGIEGVLIDWVVIRGFYENLGFSQIWEFDGYDW